MTNANSHHDKQGKQSINVDSLTMVGTSRGRVGSTWGVVVVSLTVGSRSVRHDEIVLVCKFRREMIYDAFHTVDVFMMEDKRYSFNRFWRQIFDDAFPISALDLAIFFKIGARAPNACQDFFRPPISPFLYHRFQITCIFSTF